MRLTAYAIAATLAIGCPAPSASAAAGSAGGHGPAAGAAASQPARIPMSSPLRRADRRGIAEPDQLPASSTGEPRDARDVTARQLRKLQGWLLWPVSFLALIAATFWLLRVLLGRPGGGGGGPSSGSSIGTGGGSWLAGAFWGSGYGGGDGGYGGSGGGCSGGAE